MHAEILDDTIDSVVLGQATARPDRAALVCDDVVLTYAELQASASAFGRWMVGKGVLPGDHVGLWLPNGRAWVVAHVAIAQVGAITVPISTRLTTDEAAFIVEHARCRLLVTVDEFLGRDFGMEARGMVAALDEQVSLNVVVVDPRSQVLPTSMESFALVGSAPDTPALVQYTSGTTGRPKGCVISHRAWTNNARLSALLSGIEAAEDIVFSPSPFFHLFGSMTALMGTLSVGGCLVTTPTFTVESSAERLMTHEVKHIVAVPTVWLDLMAPETVECLRGIKGGRWGGGSFPRKALEQALSPRGLGLRLDAIYGMTEAPTLTQGREDDSLETRLGTVGRATPHVDLRIVDPVSGRELPAGAVGEITMRGYCRTMGYLRDTEALESRMTDGWFRTGDLGSLDDGGYLRVTGRLTDMVVSGGANIYAQEVEDAILELDEVALAAVVAMPDARLGEVPVAWVVLVGESRPQMDATIIEHCRLKLASYKVPRAVFPLPELPLTASGKIHKARLLEMARTANREAPR